VRLESEKPKVPKTITLFLILFLGVNSYGIFLFKNKNFHPTLKVGRVVCPKIKIPKCPTVIVKDKSCVKEVRAITEIFQELVDTIILEQ